jgi:O-antigen/teichoic acid export membrane protein
VSPVRKNIIANYAGSFWTSLMSLIFIPLYIKFVGIEAYGVVGLFGSLLALFSLLDFGLSAAMTREMARLSIMDRTGQEMRNLARTLEVIYWAVALILGIMTVGLAGPIANHWVKPERLSPEHVRQALMITGGVIALRWPAAFYCGGLRGLDRQPQLNVIQSGCATIRGLGAVGVLWLVSPTIQAFFVWQIVVSAIETPCLGAAMWRSIPGRGLGGVFALDPLRRVWQFSLGVTGISAAVLLLTQTDKIILSKMLTLEQFGYYMLAWTVSAALLSIIIPIESAVYPTLTRHVAEEDPHKATEIYHKSCQIQAVLLVPAALVLILFGDVVLDVWSGNPGIVQNVTPILSILAVGTCLNGFMHMPYLAQLAYGWTSLAFYQNVVSVILLVPVMVLLTMSYQASGAAYAWVILNAGYFVIVIHVMHRRLLRNIKWEWYLYDVGLPAITAGGVALASRMLMPGQITPFLTLYVGAVGVLCLLSAALVAQFPRTMLLAAAKTVFGRARARTRAKAEILGEATQR